MVGDLLRPASFRNVACAVDASESEQGRRVQVHQYPAAGEERPAYVEDLGPNALKFNVTGFITGANYFGQRDALLKALNQGGVGKLVHPWFGTKNVFVGTVKVTNSADEGRMVRFDIEFHEAGLNQFPKAEKDLIGSLLDKADLLDNGIVAMFTEKFNLGGLSDFLSKVNVDGIIDKLNNLSNLGGLLDMAMQAPFMQKIQQVIGAVTDLVATPKRLAAQVLGLFTDLTGAFKNPLAGITALKDMFKSKPLYSATKIDDSHLLPDAIRQAKANTEATDLLFESAALSAAAATAVARPDGVIYQLNDYQQDFAPLSSSNSVSAVAAQSNDSLFGSLDEALVVRDDLLAWVDGLARTASDAVYVLLQDFRVAIAITIPDVEVDLPRLVTMRPRKVLPVLALAYQLHGDSSRAAEILHHNPVAHPGFMPTHDLKILAD